MTTLLSLMLTQSAWCWPQALLLEVGGVTVSREGAGPEHPRARSPGPAAPRPRPAATPAAARAAASQTEHHLHVDPESRPVAVPAALSAAQTQTNDTLLVSPPTHPGPLVPELRPVGTSLEMSAFAAEGNSGREEQPCGERSIVLSTDGGGSHSSRPLHGWGTRNALAGRAFLTTAPLRQAQVGGLQKGFQRSRVMFCDVGAVRTLLPAAQASLARQTDDPGSARDLCTTEQQVLLRINDACRASTGSQTELPGFGAAKGVFSSSAVQTMLVSRKDTGSNAGTQSGVADKGMKTDSTALSKPGGKGSSSRQLSASPGVGIASVVEAQKTILSPPATQTGSDGAITERSEVANVRAIAANTEQAATRVSAFVQTEELVMPAAASGRADALVNALLSVLPRPQGQLLGPEQRPCLHSRSAEAQTNSIAALRAHDSPVIPHLRKGQAGALGQGTQVRTPNSRSLSLDCAEACASGAAIVATAAEGLDLPNMEAAAAHQLLTCSGLADEESVLVGSSSSEDKEREGQHRNPVTSAVLSADMPGGPRTPRRHIHRRLWRSGRTDEWADLPAAHSDDVRTHAISSPAPTADESRSCIGSLFSSSMSSDSVGCSSSANCSVLSHAPVTLAVACQTSPSGRDAVNISDDETDSVSPGSDCSSASRAPFARAAACQTSQASREVVRRSEAFFCKSLYAQSSDTGDISSWLTSLSLRDSRTPQSVASVT